MADVAAVVGVHQTTVSLALRNHPSIPSATRERIRAAAKRIGYRPDPFMDAFNFHRLSHHPVRSAPLMAFLSDLPSRAAFDASVKHSELYAGVRTTAEELGYIVERFFIGPRQLSAMRLGQILAARNIHAVIVGAFGLETTALPLEWEPLCALKIESFHVQPLLDVVTPDHCQAARIIIRQLRAHNRWRIGLVLNQAEDTRLENLHLVGYLLEHPHEVHNRRIEPLYLEDEPADRQAARLRQWIAEHRVEAVVSNLGGVPDLLARAEPEPTRRPVFASLDLPGLAAATPGIHTNYRVVGERAAELLAIRMQSNERGLPATPATTLIPVDWADGPAAAPALAPA